MRKRYAHVGIGVRSRMFIRAITETYRDNCRLVAFCDTNDGRMELERSRLPGEYANLPLYAAQDFDLMIVQQKPNVVIITTPDSHHDHYIVRAMELGCDVITEKPLTTTAEKCQRVMDVARKTGRDMRVTFNYRYAPPRSQVKQLLLEGVIGDVLSADFHWLLDTTHGADYYRRWHRHKKNSGGLIVHKATHHFDLVNWWFNSVPVEVYAMGKRSFYGPDTAKRYGLAGHTERCRACPVFQKCPFFLDLGGNEKLKALYLDQEHYDGYYRDRCVFGEEIDIEDTMNVVVRYWNGAMLSYSLNSFMPWEGYTIAFNGTKGRLEHKMVETVYISGDGSTPGKAVHGGTSIRIFPHFQEPYDVEVSESEGGHGGGDILLLEDIFAETSADDPLKRAAGYADGAHSILTGVAANISMAENRPVRIDSLVSSLPGN